MRAVIDTNVLVSGLLKKRTAPAQVIADIVAGLLVPLYDQRIIIEYREVLARPKFKIAPAQVDAILEVIVADGVEVLDARFDQQLPDPDDQAFADVAFSGRAGVLITGNAKHFPIGTAIRGASPREWLELREEKTLAPGDEKP